MIKRKSSSDSTRTYCPVSEQKKLEMRKDNHSLLKYIHSKILQHVRMEKLIEPAEVHLYIQLIKKVHIDQPNIESFRKKIRNMLLTINDSLVQFEQAVCSGEVALYSPDTERKCNFSQQSSGTSVAEVPSFSSIELTNMDFMTIPSNSQNSNELDFGNKNNDTPINFVCKHFKSKVSPVEQKMYERSKITNKSSNEEYFKKPVKRNHKLKIKRSNIDKSLLNNKENLNFSIYHKKNGINSICNKIHDLGSYTPDKPDIFSSELEIINMDSSSDISVYETQMKNHENKFSQNFSNNSKEVEQIKNNNSDNEITFQELHSQNESSYNTNHVRKLHCDAAQLHAIKKPSLNYMEENRMMNSTEERGNNTNCIAENVIPETKMSCKNTKNEQLNNIELVPEKKRNFTQTVSNLNQITSNDSIFDKSNCKSTEYKDFVTNSQLKKNIIQSFFSSISDSTFSESKNYISQTNDESNTFNEPEYNTYLLEYHKYNNKPDNFILYKKIQPVIDDVETTRKFSSLTFRFEYNENIDKDFVAVSNNILAIDGKFVSVPHNNYSKPHVRQLMHNQYDCGSGFEYGNIKKLCGKMALAAEHCFNTWDEFIQSLEEVENSIPSEKFTKEKKLTIDQKNHNDTMEKICNEYIKRFNYHRDTNKTDKVYISIEKKIQRWSEFQDLIKKMKEARKRKHDII